MNDRDVENHLAPVITDSDPQGDPLASTIQKVRSIRAMASARPDVLNLLREIENGARRELKTVDSLLRESGGALSRGTVLQAHRARLMALLSECRTDAPRGG
jgi:hypothetical protein